MLLKKSVLITGCSDDGIGSTLAITFQEQGYLVFAAVRNLAKASKLEDLPNVKLVQLDVLNSEDIKEAVTTVTKETGGKLDYLINNAARNHFMPILDEDIDTCKKLFDTNLWAPLAITQAFSPLLIEAHGTLVFITSVSGYVNVPYMGTYAASKRSVEILADTLRLELAPFHVRVLSVVTGAVQTQGQTYFEDWGLPVGSRYAGIEATIRSRAQGGDTVGRMDARTYARSVVAEVTRESGWWKWRKTKIWMGSMVWGVWVMVYLLPQWVMDNGVIVGTGIDRLLKQGG